MTPMGAPMSTDELHENDWPRWRLMAVAALPAADIVLWDKFREPTMIQ
jgi:hypothetical protein